VARKTRVLATECEAWHFHFERSSPIRPTAVMP